MEEELHLRLEIGDMVGRTFCLVEREYEGDDDVLLFTEGDGTR
jgi:hypothetical protein